jgi:hypothetical protein
MPAVEWPGIEQMNVMPFAGTFTVAVFVSPAFAAIFVRRRT